MARRAKPDDASSRGTPAADTRPAAHASESGQRGTGTPRPRDRATQLLAIAEDLFARKGYHAVGVADIAAEADISGPALYRHFSSKQALFSNVLTDALEATKTAVDAALAAHPTPGRARLRAVTESLGELAVQRRTALVLWRWNAAELPHEERARIVRRSRTMIAAVADALHADRGDLTVDQAELLCQAALGVFGSVAVHRTRLPRARFVALLADLASEVLMAELPDPAGHPRRPEPVAPGGRREEVLHAATRLFAERGYNAVSMADIGGAVGLAAASVYRHFPNKDELLRTAGRRMGERLGAEASQILSTVADPSEALAAVLESYVDNLWRFSDLATVYNREIRALAESERAELMAVQREYVTNWVALLRKIDPDRSEAEARVIAHAGLTVVNDLSRSRTARARPAHRAESIALGRAALGLDVPGAAGRATR